MDEVGSCGKEESQFSLSIRKRCIGVYNSESQSILFQLRVGFAGKFGKSFKGKNV